VHWLAKIVETCVCLIVFVLCTHTHKDANISLKITWFILNMLIGYTIVYTLTKKPINSPPSRKRLDFSLNGEWVLSKHKHTGYYLGTLGGFP
jgi:hypothetical protein